MSKSVLLFLPDGKQRVYENVSDFKVLPYHSVVFKTKEDSVNEAKITTNLPYIKTEKK